MKTITLQIGNSDDKLPQKKYAAFCDDLFRLVNMSCESIYFNGHSAGNAEWQNYCIVADCDDLGWMQQHLEILCRTYGQDSIAVTVGKTAFVRPASNASDHRAAYKETK